jgi:hypothetical protein
MDGETLKDRLQQVADLYYMLVGPHLLALGVGIGSSPPLLAWTAGLLLLAMTINKAVFVLRK